MGRAAVARLPPPDTAPSRGHNNERGSTGDMAMLESDTCIQDTPRPPSETCRGGGGHGGGAGGGGGQWPYDWVPRCHGHEYGHLLGE